MPSSKKKGSEKAKQKKKERKERMLREKAGKELVKAASGIEDIFSILTAFKVFRKLDAEGVYKRYEDLTKEEKAWTFTLLEKNMKKHYEGCESVGWDASAKKKEMDHEGCRYVIFYSKETQKNENKDFQNAKPADQDTPLGYAMWRFLMDDNGAGEWLPVLYLWEIHIEEKYRSKGLGKHLMLVSELAAWKLKMKKIMLTAFSSNPDSLRFFQQKMKFQFDDTDPLLCEPDEPCGYRILSKTRMNP
eukprot:CAMPEP_0170178468 /NCGR_PEP_ID=MMETSP0040_2-20121228/11903_1 /TAXON_ID=641309 /ORGANISM="Lotharella oceanica, Strain CCMP622" /LENGTH=245 /DNA_ID=CAMNT_0010421531 /DNA_START=31 /DNA_END=768 /DNA_ORIENTATION=+